MTETKPEKDWRIGKLVTPKHRYNTLWGIVAVIVDVLPDNTYGLADTDGVLVLRVVEGSIVLYNALLIQKANEWVSK